MTKSPAVTPWNTTRRALAGRSSPRANKRALVPVAGMSSFSYSKGVGEGRGGHIREE